MIIISMVFGMAIMIYLNIYKANGQSLKTEAAIVLQDAWANTERAQAYTNGSWQYGDFVVSREVTPMSSDELLMIRFEMRDDHLKLVAERKFLKYVAQ